MTCMCKHAIRMQIIIIIISIHFHLFPIESSGPFITLKASNGSKKPRSSPINLSQHFLAQGWQNGNMELIFFFV